MRKLIFGSLLVLCYLNSALAVDRIIVKYKDDASQVLSSNTNASGMLNERMQPLAVSQITELERTTGVGITEVNQVANGAHVIKLDNDVSESRLQQIMATIQEDSDVQYVEEDKLLQPASVPTINPVQWDMQGTATYNQAWVGDNFTAAWESYANYSNLAPGHGITIAVIDTGYTPHPNFLSHLQLESTASSIYGYQFISDCRISGSCLASTSSNTTISPQKNALDLGDYLTQSQINASNGFFSNICQESNSSWHGTHVTGTIIAQGYTGTGVAGGAYGAMVVPIRVLGKCGGYTSDIANAINWAVNQYPGITNYHPAQVISMSLGGSGSCSSTLQGAINAAYNAHAIVVVAAGNSSANVSNFNPANCNHVISVAAKGPTSALAFYSNFGATTITASGGDSHIAGSSSTVYSTIWSSLQQYESNGSGIWAAYQGTSMATPHVSAAVADILSLESGMSFESIVTLLQNTASQNYSKCNSYGCVVTGTLDVARAINYVAESLNQYFLTPSVNGQTINIVTIAGTAPTVTITFTNNNANNVTIESTIFTESGSNTITMANGCTESLVLAAHGGSCQVTLTGTSIVNSNQSEANLRIISTDPSAIVADVGIATSVSAASSSGGGGCTMVREGDDYSMLLILMLGAIIYAFMLGIRQRKR